MDYIHTLRTRWRRLTLTLLLIGAALALLVVRPAHSQSPVRIMPLGDSITQADDAHDSYRRPLWQQLTNAAYNVNFVGSLDTNDGGLPPHPDFDLDNEGHWGYRADQINASITGWATAAQPDIVLIHLGSNDIFQGQSNASTITDLRNIIRAIKAVNPNVKILLAQIIPHNQSGSPSVSGLNALIPQLAADESTTNSPVYVVDMATGFNAVTMTYDNVHPNVTGENFLANRWYSALVPLLSGSPLPTSTTTPTRTNTVPVTGTLTATATSSRTSTAAPTNSPTSTITGTTGASAFYRAINLGGAATVIDGHNWEANTGTTPNFTTLGDPFCATWQTITPATDAARTAMIQCSRQHWAHNAVMSGVPNGTYQVYVYTWLDWSDPNPPAYSFYVQGQLVQTNYQSGPVGKWDRLGPWTATVTAGTITVQTNGGLANLSGIEVYFLGAPATSTPSSTVTPSFTPSTTFTPSATRTASATITRTLSRTPSQTIMPSSTPPLPSTNTPSVTNTASITPSFTVSATATKTRTPTSTASQSGGGCGDGCDSTTTPSATNTATSTSTASVTVTATNTPTETLLPSATNTATETLPPTATTTPTASFTPSVTNTATDPATASLTATATDTPTETLPPSATNTLTATFTPSVTNTSTLTSTASLTNTASVTSSPSATITASLTTTPTFTPTTTGTSGSPSPTFYRAINLGGAAVAIDGHNWEANTGTTPNFTTNGTAFCNQWQVLTPSTDAARASMITCSRQHWAYNAVMSAMPNGVYQVYAYTWLDWSDPNPPAYTFYLQGQVVQANYQSGPAGKWDRLGPWTVSVTNGTLTLQTSGGVANLSGIEVYSMDGVVIPTSTPTQTLTPSRTLTATVTRTLTPTRTVTSTRTPTRTPTIVPTLWNAYNLNGSQLTISSVVWKAGDVANGVTVTNGTGLCNQSITLNPTASGNKASMIRCSVNADGTNDMTVNVANVPNGTYDVYVTVWENDASTTFWLSLENGQVFVPTVTTGTAGWWQRLGAYTVTITDGNLQIVAGGGLANLSGLELFQR